MLLGILERSIKSSWLIILLMIFLLIFRLLFYQLLRKESENLQQESKIIMDLPIFPLNYVSFAT